MATEGIASETAGGPSAYGEGQAVGYAVDSGRLVVAPRVEVGWAFSSGALCSTVGDLVGWTRALASGKVVSRTSYELMTTPLTFRSPRPMTYGFALTASRAAPGGQSVGLASTITEPRSTNTPSAAARVASM